MTAPRFSPGRYRWFAVYLDRFLRRNFHGVRVSRGASGPDPDSDRPWIVYSNHPSWWDPLLYMAVARRYFPGRPGYGPMDAEMLRRYKFFARLGAFPVEPGSRRGAVQFLRAGAEVLARPGAVLWMTAEGRFVDPRVRPTTIRPGLGHLVHRSGPVTVVPLALEYTFWSERRPEALLRFGAPVDIEDGSTRTAVEWTEKFRAGLQDTLRCLADDAMTRDPSRFTPLLRGRAGTSFVYDSWRRIVARVRGERFRAAHLDGG